VADGHPEIDEIGETTHLHARSTLIYPAYPFGIDLAVMYP
jgi:hypothetical protein